MLSAFNVPTPLPLKRASAFAGTQLCELVCIRTRPLGAARRLPVACASGSHTNPSLTTTETAQDQSSGLVQPSPSTHVPSSPKMDIEASSCPSLGHRMRFTEVSGLRRWLRGPRMFLRLRGRLSRGTVLTMRLGGVLPAAEERLSFFSPPPKYPSLLSVMRALRLSAHDPRIAHIFMRVDPLDCGWAKLLEVRRHLEYYCESGKGISVFMEGGGEKEYFLTCGLPNTEVYVAPEGTLSLRGFMASGSFVRGALEKIGIDPQVERIGKFKSAGDQLSRKTMSPEQRMVIDSLLAQIQNMFVTSLAHCKNMSEAQVLEILDKGYQDMQEYVDAGLITGTKYEMEIEDDLKLRFKRKSEKEEKEEILKRKLSTVKVIDYVRRTSEKMLGLGGRRKVGVIHAFGAITGGKNSQSPVLGATVGNETMVELFRKALDDESIKAVILRVDSPGGSALASDIIWRAVAKLAEKKPVIASMVDVAASGGYYISMGLPIVAECATLTGSIGVVTAKPSFEELYKKLGLSKETLSRGRYAELLTDNRPFSSDELEYFRQGTERAYRSFVGKAASSRGMEFEDMDRVAQGRVWTGLQARDCGLVDELGGFWKAVELAKDKAGIREDEFVRVEEIQVRQGLFEKLGLSGASVTTPAGGGVVSKMLTSGEPLALAEVDATIGSSRESSSVRLSPLQRLTYAGVLELVAAVPGGQALESITKSLLEWILQ